MIKFAEMCSSTMTLDKQNYFGVVNNINANNVFFKINLPEKFKECLTYVGGFTDSAYFVKSKIENLSSENKKEFLKLICGSITID